MKLESMEEIHFYLSMREEFDEWYKKNRVKDKLTEPQKEVAQQVIKMGGIRSGKRYILQCLLDFFNEMSEGD